MCFGIESLISELFVYVEPEKNMGIDTCETKQNSENNNMQENVRLTNFFIEEILKPDFGKHKILRNIPVSCINTERRSVSPSPSQSPTHSPTNGGKDEVALKWPAWVYCTRYSDRPSSGKYKILI